MHDDPKTEADDDFSEMLQQFATIKTCIRSSSTKPSLAQPTQKQSHWADFNEIWYEAYATEKYLVFIYYYSSSANNNVTDVENLKVGQ